MALKDKKAQKKIDASRDHEKAKKNLDNYQANHDAIVDGIDAGTRPAWQLEAAKAELVEAQEEFNVADKALKAA